MSTGRKPSESGIHVALRNVNTQIDTGHITRREDRDDAIYRILDKIGFNWLIWSVAALGFLASSSTLFATNSISPAIAFLYPLKGRLTVDAGEAFDLATLCGTLSGMVICGHIADRYGRKKFYGWEMATIILATFNIALASEGYMIPDANGNGYHSSMSIYAQLTVWRFVLGLAIGAEYPMSALIASEFVATSVRGTTLAAVFGMQSVGRMLAFGFGLGFLRGHLRDLGLSPDDQTPDTKLVIDAFWRLVVGLAGIFACFTIGLRFMIPESPRYYGRIAGDLLKASQAVEQINPIVTAGELASLNSSFQGDDNNNDDDESPTPWLQSACSYFWIEGWKRLLTISFIWAALDVCFYGTGLDSPNTLNSLWLAVDPAVANGTVPGGNYTPSNSTNSTFVAPGINDWRQDQAYINETIFWVLDNNAVRTLELSSISSLAGSIIVIPLVNYLPRRQHLLWTSLILSVIFFTTGALVWTRWATPSHTVAMVFYSLAQFFFNLGPNTITFVMAAEIFPTVFRGTFYGLAAASGKAGAIIIRVIVQKMGKDRVSLAAMLFVYGGVMLIVAGLTTLKCALPDVQKWIGKDEDKGLNKSAKNTGKDTGKDIRKGAEEDVEKDAGNVTEKNTETDVENDAEKRKHWWSSPWANLTLEEIAPIPLPGGLISRRGTVVAQQTGDASGPPPRAEDGDEMGNSEAQSEAATADETQAVHPSESERSAEQTEEIQRAVNGNAGGQ